ncbi:MAG: flagellar assembly protein FliH [Alteromonadaceae bacterium]|nr:flagellar assembly protein FliH [Alteromonadaceae bacterium]
MRIKNQQNHGIIHPDEEGDLKTWPLPHVEDEKQQLDEQATNAFGLKNTWKYEPPEETIEEPKPLTAEEIEKIRQAAFDEGFSQGKDEGFTQGHEEGIKTGHQEGIKTGHEEGLAQGLAAAEQQITELTTQWQTLIDKLHTPLLNVDKNVEQQLFILVEQLTAVIVRHEAKTNADIIMSAISEAIKALPAHDAQTQIYLHPDDIKRVEKAFGEEHIKTSGWRLLPAPQLEIGGCQVENSTSNIDMRIKSRLTEVLEPFLQNALHQ